jgi:hypothetical protein
VAAHGLIHRRLHGVVGCDCHSAHLGSSHIQQRTDLGPFDSSLLPQELVNNKWRKKKWEGPVQYEDRSGQLMMLPTE